MAELKTFDLGYGGLLRGIERGQDRADKKREREEDKIFTAEQNELNRQAQINQIKATGEQTRKNIEFQGDVDINKIKTTQDFDALMQQRKQDFLAGESGKDRDFKSTQLDKQIAASKEEWMAKLNSTENLFERGNEFQMALEKFKQDGNMEALRTRLTASASENALDREAAQFLQKGRLDNATAIANLDRLSRERINNKNIIANALESEKDRLLKKNMQKQDLEDALTRMEKGLEFRLKEAKELGTIEVEQARIMKQQEADKTYSFDPGFLASLKDEKGGIFGLGFNESDVLENFRGDPEDPNKPNMFQGLATNVQQVLQTSPNNPQREKVINALIEVQKEFSDEKYYGSIDRFDGESAQALANVQGVQNLLMLMGPKGREAIIPFDPNNNNNQPNDAELMPRINALGNKVSEDTQEIMNALIQSMQNTPSVPATSTPSNMPVN
jgi:hypothetical protein